MSKQDLINAFYAKKQAAVQAAEDSAVNEFADACMAEGVASVPPGGGAGISQADLDKAVEDARAAMQVNLDALKEQLGSDDALVASHVAMEASLHAKLDSIKALIDAE